MTAVSSGPLSIGRAIFWPEVCLSPATHDDDDGRPRPPHLAPGSHTPATCGTARTRDRVGGEHRRAGDLHDLHRARWLPVRPSTCRRDRLPAAGARPAAWGWAVSHHGGTETVSTPWPGNPQVTACFQVFLFLGNARSDDPAATFSLPELEVSQDTAGWGGHFGAGGGVCSGFPTCSGGLQATVDRPWRQSRARRNPSVEHGTGCPAVPALYPTGFNHAATQGEP